VPHTCEYPRGALTVDCVVFGLDDDELEVTLSQLQHLYGLLLERELDERNFRKPVLAMDTSSN
jgi:hypothetical protein